METPSLTPPETYVYQHVLEGAKPHSNQKPNRTTQTNRTSEGF